MHPGWDGQAKGDVLAAGGGWRVVDLRCGFGPGDRPFEERYLSVAVSLVLSGSFFYRCSQGASLMLPGSFLLGNAGCSYECSHEYATGDRCLSFQFDPAFFDDIAGGSGARSALFKVHRIPPIRSLAPLTARAIAAMRGGGDSFEEIALETGAAALRAAAFRDANDSTAAGWNRRRVADVIGAIEDDPAREHSLGELAEIAGLSRYRFLRVFRAVTGITPHQWLLRARLRQAAHLLTSTREPVTRIALDSGFEDLSNFIRSFRSEFGKSPREYRARG